MGKATISSHLGAGLYEIEYLLDKAYADAQAARLTTDQAQLSADLSDLQTALDAETAAANTLLAQYSAALDAWVSCLNTPGCSDGSSRYDVVVKAMSALAEQRQKVFAAKTAYAETQAKVLNVIAQLAYYAATAPVSKTLQVWSVDYPETAPIPANTVVGTIETYSAKGAIGGGWMQDAYCNIQPTDSASYDKTRDGCVKPMSSQGVATNTMNFLQFLNTSTNNPRYSIGRITALDVDNDLADVELFGAHHSRRIASGYPFRHGQTSIALTALPVSYGLCNAEAFRIGDEVVVKFSAIGLSGGMVIGFADHPRRCTDAVPFYIWAPRLQSPLVGWGRPFNGYVGTLEDSGAPESEGNYVCLMAGIGPPISYPGINTKYGFEGYAPRYGAPNWMGTRANGQKEVYSWLGSRDGRYGIYVNDFYGPITNSLAVFKRSAQSHLLPMPASTSDGQPLQVYSVGGFGIYTDNFGDEWPVSVRYSVYHTSSVGDGNVAIYYYIHLLVRLTDGTWQQLAQLSATGIYNNYPPTIIRAWLFSPDGSNAVNMASSGEFSGIGDEPVRLRLAHVISGASQGTPPTGSFSEDTSYADNSTTFLLAADYDMSNRMVVLQQTRVLDIQESVTPNPDSCATWPYTISWTRVHQTDTTTTVTDRKFVDGVSQIVGSSYASFSQTATVDLINCFTPVMADISIAESHHFEKILYGDLRWDQLVLWTDEYSGGGSGHNEWNDAGTGINYTTNSAGSSTGSVVLLNNGQTLDLGSYSRNLSNSDSGFRSGGWIDPTCKSWVDYAVTAFVDSGACNGRGFAVRAAFFNNTDATYANGVISEDCIITIYDGYTADSLGSLPVPQGGQPVHSSWPGFGIIDDAWIG